MPLPIKNQNVSPHCCNCPAKSKLNTYIPGKGSLSAKYAIIGDCPTSADMITHTPYSGKNGGVIRSALTRMGIDKDDVYVTYMVKCMIPKADEDVIKCCKKHLEEEMSLLKNVRLVVTMGAAVSQHMACVDGGILTVTGNIVEGYFGPTLCCISPGHVLANSTLEKLLLTSLEPVMNLDVVSKVFPDVRMVGHELTVESMTERKRLKDCMLAQMVEKRAKDPNFKY